jgi:hypothetical protein
MVDYKNILSVQSLWLIVRTGNILRNVVFSVYQYEGKSPVRMRHASHQQYARISSRKGLRPGSHSWEGAVLMVFWC